MKEKSKTNKRLPKLFVVFYKIVGILFLIGLVLQIFGFNFNIDYWGIQKTVEMFICTIIMLLLSILIVVVDEKDKRRERNKNLHIMHQI